MLRLCAAGKLPFIKRIWRAAWAEAGQKQEKQEESDHAVRCIFDLADFLSEPGADKAEELLGKWPDWKARLENCGPVAKVLAEELEVTAERVAGALDEFKAKDKEDRHD